MAYSEGEAVFFKKERATLEYVLSNRAPAKHVALWEEEQTRSSSICSANSYDKRIATSERSYEGIGFIQERFMCGIKPRQMFEVTTNFSIKQKKI